MVNLSWLIPLFPLLSFIMIVFFMSKNEKLSSYFAISMVVLSCLFSFGVLFEVLRNPEPFQMSFNWLTWSNFKVPIGIFIDPLTAVMLIVVTIVSSLVHIYSLGYMHGDPRFSRFYSYLSLFTFSMLGLVLAGSYILILVFWELVGLTSYLLIGFWFEKKIAADAGKKAFVTTKFADMGFLLGLVLLVVTLGTASIPEVNKIIASGQAPTTMVAIAGLLMFMGACGKSAQFPFHVWLPDAMEGPTPVSALIHAATMVAAGVYLTARLTGVILVSPTMGLVVASIGAITALMAASIGLVQNDIKRVLAYSTVSQLGYMMMILGLGGYTAGTFHLYTHAFFKALLFLGAGSVIHAVHTNNIQEMGGLSNKMKITSMTFLIASLSIAGIFPLSGFWSKDERGQRPLPPAQKSYARYDSHYLIPLRQRLHAELVETGRWELAQEDFQRLCQTSVPNPNHPADACWRLAGNTEITPRQAAVLQALCEYREIRARQSNQPQFKVLSNSALVELALASPQNMAELMEIRSISPRLLERHADGLLRAIHAGQLNAPPPRPRRNHNRDEELSNRLDALRNWRKETGQRWKVESDVILPRDVMQAIAEANPRDLPALEKIMESVLYRFKKFGTDIIAAIH